MSRTGQNLIVAAALTAVAAAQSSLPALLPGFQRSPWFEEQITLTRPADKVRLLRTLEPEETLVLLCVQPTPLSWPTWRHAHGGGDAEIHSIVADLLDVVPGEDERKITHKGKKVVGLGGGTFGGPPAYRDWVQAAPGTGWIDRSARDFPPRAEGAPGGRTVFAEIGGLSLTEREARILAEIDAGNVPDHLRRSVTVELRAKGPRGKRLRARIDVLPDYLAIGGDDDFVRVPLTPAAAQRVADRYGYTLPTTRIVDAINAAADVRLEPLPLTEARASAATFVQHDDLIAAALAKQRSRTGPLISGIKKDVVITPRLAERAERVALYGWHRSSGEPIQPLYVGHVETYVDYSHGIRLVRRAVEIGGTEVDISELLTDPARCALVSDEGPIAPAQQRYAPD